MAYRDPAAHREYQARWAAEHPEQHRETRNKAARTQHAKRKLLLNGIKLEAGCVDCGYNEHAVALQFDHVRGEKSFNISSSIKKSWANILLEIEKCDVRCANCHAIRTEERRLDNG